jgi:hypothetical protein
MIVLLVAAFIMRPPSGTLVVHEWGTITTRHAPDGTPQGRLNRIEPSETLPSFVHQYDPPPTRADPAKSTLKSPIGPGRPDVTMRLETPVIYFHPAGAPDPNRTFDVRVRFRGGVINEFYPSADASVELDTARIGAKLQTGLLRGWDGAVLNNYVLGELSWRGIALDAGGSLPATTNHVWLAPRAARSTSVKNGGGEAERYLFYRGVAHLDALFQTTHGPDGVRLRAPRALHWMSGASMTVPRVWLLDVRADGRSAFREHEKIVIDRSSAGADLLTLAPLPEAEYGRDAIAALRKSMKRSLVGAGLFDDEAEAMLETWRDSYFAAPGTRLLYIVPNEWTAYFLPLEISVPHTLRRVLVGRIDLLDAETQSW